VSFQHPYPIKYDGYGGKVCPACLNMRNDHTVLEPFWVRGVKDDFASLLGVCPRCGHNETLVHTTPLTEDTKSKLTAPPVKTSRV
jgi:hypothetical protein